MKQRIFLLTLLFLLILTRTNDISAKETKLNEDMFTNVENTLKDKEIDLSYTQLVKQLIHGNVKGVLHTIKAKMKEVFLNRMLIQKDLIREILLIAFTAAIFKNLSDSFFQQSTANSAFYITYVILCGVMVHSFFYLNKTVTQLVTLMADYMKGMIMAYSLAVVSTSGITTSTTVYEFYLLLIYAMTTLTNVVLLPMIKILFVLKIINHISKEEHFSRLCKTLEGVIKFLLKGFLSVLLGVQLIQSMILPAVDSMKNTVLQKGMSAIPGIGSGLNSAMTMVIGSAVVIKNSIGAVGILVLIVIIVPPVIEITAVVLTYLLAGIMIQPISDKRITGAMDAVIQSGKLMLSMIFTMALLFILSVALCGVRIMDYLKMIIFFLILTTLIDQLCDKSIYRPYLRLMTGFMLISLMMQPISYYLSNEDILTQAISTAVKGENNPAFLDGAKEEKQNQIKEQITTLFSQYDLKVLDVDSKVNEKGTIEKIDIKTDKLRHTKKLKTAISNFYNMKESNINISE